MAWVFAHTGDLHVEEGRYFGDTAQCLDWFVADAVRTNVDLFVIRRRLDHLQSHDQGTEPLDRHTDPDG